MAAYGTESIPSSWDDERDTAFFRITGHLFSCEFTFGAGVLLASYDDDAETAAASTMPAATAAPIPATSTSHHASAR